MIKLLINLCFILATTLNAFASEDILYQREVIAKDGTSIIKTNKVVHLSGPIYSRTYNNFKVEYDRVKDIKGDLLLIINSPGGEVGAGTKILKLLNEHKKTGAKLVCFVERGAHSMAFNILSNCDVRIGSSRSIYLVHKIAFSMIMEHDGFRLTAKNLRLLAKELDQGDQEFRLKNAKELNYSLEDYDIIADNDTIFSATTLYIRGYLHYIGTLN